MIYCNFELWEWNRKVEFGKGGSFKKVSLRLQGLCYWELRVWAGAVYIHVYDMCS